MNPCFWALFFMLIPIPASKSSQTYVKRDFPKTWKISPTYPRVLKGGAMGGHGAHPWDPMDPPLGSHTLPPPGVPLGWAGAYIAT